MTIDEMNDEKHDETTGIHACLRGCLKNIRRINLLHYVEERVHFPTHLSLDVIHAALCCKKYSIPVNVILHVATI